MRSLLALSTAIVAVSGKFAANRCRPDAVGAAVSLTCGGTNGCYAAAA